MNFMKHIRTSCKITALLLCLACLLSLTACGEGRMVQIEVDAMDTVMSLTAYGKNAEAGLSSAKSVILSMDAMLDPELNSSLVRTLNTANGAPTVVSGQVANMIATAQTVYAQSGGALDLSIYPLVKLWGFVDDKYYVPTEPEISEALSKLCFGQVKLNSFPSSGTYSVEMPAGAEISFGAVAKGCASQYAIDAMRQAGVESAVISLGGNVQTLGLKPDGTKWNIAVQDPSNPASYVGVLSAGESAIVTSGSYQRYFTGRTDGKTYHHILNPKTGYPADNTLLSVTIICDDGTMADALSTAMFVVGETRALNYWRNNGGFEMILITNDHRIICTKGLIEQFTLANDGYTVSYTE